MLVIMMNSIREKIRSKTIYIVGGMGIAIILFLVLNGSFSYKGQTMISFTDLISPMVIMVGFLASMLAVTLSLQTIPREYENKTCRLIMVRGIRSYEYTLGLTLSNIVISIVSLAILYSSIIIFNIMRGSQLHITRHIRAFFIMSVSAMTISAIISLLSTKLPLAVNALLGVVLYMLGSFHHLISVYGKTLDGLAGATIKGLLYIIPDFHIMNKQVGLILAGKPIQVAPIIAQLFFCYVVITLLLVSSEREV